MSILRNVNYMPPVIYTFYFTYKWCYFFLELPRVDNNRWLMFHMARSKVYVSILKISCYKRGNLYIHVKCNAPLNGFIARDMT